jgi:hypothetical protein
MKVKGNKVSISDMGRMIDSYLIADRDEKGKWWCFYKQNGVSISTPTTSKTGHLMGKQSRVKISVY